MIFRQTSATNAIAKAYRDFNLPVSEMQAYAFEWVGEAVQSIGAYTQMMFKSSGNEGTDTALYVTDHSVMLPCDVESILAVEYQGSRLPLGNDDTIYGLACHPRTTNATPNTSLQATQYAGNHQGTQQALDNVYALPEATNGDYYQVNLPYLVTSFEEGFVKIHYNAYPTDSHGLPLVPDHYYYLTAIAFYILWKVLSRGYQHPTYNVTTAYGSWTHYKLLAQTKAKKMTKDQLERFRRRWVTLIPEHNSWMDFGMNDHNPQEIVP